MKKNVKKIKRIKPKDFDWDGFQQGKVCIVSDSSQNLLAVLLALSEKGYYWGISGQSLIEDSVTTDQLLDDIKQESIYIRAGGDLEHGVICDYTDRRYPVMIDFKEDNMKEIKRVKVNKFDSTAFKRKEFRIAMSSPRSVTDTLRFLSERGYVWGWSKTSLVKDTHMKTKLLEMVKDEPVYIWIGGDVPNGVLHDCSYISYSGESVEIDFGEQSINSKIVITNDGKITTATLYSNGKKAGIGTAVCHGDDTFDVYAGAKLALERLEKNKKETEMSDWEKFVKGKVNMRVPKKHIKNFLDRAEKDDVTFQGLMSDWYFKWLTQDGDSIVFSVDCDIEKTPIVVEVIHGDWGRTVDYFPGMK